MSKFGTPPFTRDPLAYSDSRLANVPTVEGPRDPTVNDTNYPIQTIWRNKDTFRECILVGFTGGEAQWVCFTDSDGTMLDLIADDGNTVSPLSGNITVTGSTVANATHSKPLFTNGSVANNLIIDLQVATERTGAPADNNDAGIVSFDDTAFSVDANGYVTLVGGGGPAIDSVNVDDSTGPGTDPVLPDGSGQVTVAGAVVSAHSIPIETHSRAVNTYNIEAQVASAVAATPANANDAGLASFDNIYFNTSTSSGFTSIEERLLQEPAGTTLNLGIDYSSPTFTVTSSDGTALSATNPGWVVIPSILDGGKKIVYKVTADVSFDDASGTSDIVGNLFGTTTAIAWSEQVPFFMYAVAEDSDADVTFMISRVPNRNASPGVSNIGKSGSAVADLESSLFAIDGSITVGDYDTNPCKCIGSFRMTKDASDDWTVTALGDQDGMGCFQEGNSFGFPSDQNGASSLCLSSSVGGDTMPTTNAQVSSYYINKDGICSHFWAMDNTSSAGVGSGLIRVHTPFENGFRGSYINPPGHFIFKNISAVTWNTYVPRVQSATGIRFYEIILNGSGTAKLTPAGFTTDRQRYSFEIRFPVHVQV